MWNVIGHTPAVQSLAGMIAAGRLPHALIVTGPSGIGKRRLALELAKTLNCEGDDPPCQHCLQCRQIEGESHPDVVFIEPLEGKNSIAIGQVRILRDDAALRPFQGKSKVFIVDGAEALTDQAADALLKTLEEPQPQVQLVLLVTDSDALPATILSRCQVLPLRPVPHETVVAALRDRGTAPEDAERLARLARGRLGWALRAATQPKLAEQQEGLVEQLSGVLDLDLSQRLTLAETLTADRKDRAALRRVFEILVLLGRDLLLLEYGQRPLLATAAQAERLRAQGRRLGSPAIVHYLQRLRLTLDRIEGNVDPRLALEALLLEMP